MTAPAQAGLDLAVTQAAQLVGAVHARDRTTIAALLVPLESADLWALAVVLAGMVDPDRTPDQLLAWSTPPPEWSDALVVDQANRWRAGIRDLSAQHGWIEHHRRTKAHAALLAADDVSEEVTGMPNPEICPACGQAIDPMTGECRCSA